jgi:hypothetical protein
MGAVTLKLRSLPECKNAASLDDEINAEHYGYCGNNPYGYG